MIRNTAVTNAQLDRTAEKWRDGQNTKQIAISLGLPEWRVYEWLHEIKRLARGK